MRFVAFVAVAHFMDVETDFATPPSPNREATFGELTVGGSDLDNL